MTLKVLHMQAGGADTPIQYSSLDDRALIDAIVTTEGTLGPGSLALTQRAAGANFSVDVAAGFAAVLGDDTSLQGKYIVQNTAAYNLPVGTAPVSGSRIDRIVAQIRDKLHNSGSWSTYDWIPVCVAGTPGSGTPPSLPNSALHLGLVTVNSGDTAVLDAAISSPASSAILSGSSASSTLYVAKSANTSGTSNTTLGDDPHLQLTLLAGYEYRLELDLLYSADSGGDLKFGFGFPTGGGVDLICTGLASGSSGTTGDANFAYLNANNTITVGGAANGSNSQILSCRITGHVYSGVGGTFKLRWAQGTSSGIATIVRQYSTMTMRKMT